jgi:hypothetical protein
LTLFEYLSIGVSLVLGLGVTLLLTSLLAAFRARRHVRMDWIPFAWAGYILAIQAQYFWAMWGLNARVEEWTVMSFGLPLLLAGIIFVAAALVLPSGHGEYPADLGIYFEQDGRWAVAALVARGAVAVLANSLVYNAGQASGEAVITPALIVGQMFVGVAFLVSKRRRSRAVATVLFGLILCATIVRVTPFTLPGE